MSDIDEFRKLVRTAAADPVLVSRRFELARLAARTLEELGVELDVAGRLLGTDRLKGLSPTGNGSDETVAVALLLRVASELIGGCASLFAERRHYAAAALLRQLTEVEYLAWAFETRDRDAERWLRSTHEEREEFFRPARLRRASNGRFRNQDYRYHCELGGHPVPRAELLFGAAANETAQLLLSDALGHIGHIWNHLSAWAISHGHGDSIDRHTGNLPVLHRSLFADDPLARLPPPS
ncbi:MAG: hypothetical protein HOW73_41175 [Polyangiaceae bacterium]|nr:hypothetical protein [Polyangiaceae bacterium]